MQALSFSIKIKAPKEKVWRILWDDRTYRTWTAEFTPGSYAVTDWQEGSKALFLDPKGSGMVSTIAKNTPNEFLSIRHLGVVKEGVEDTKSAAVKGWAGAMENYTLNETNGITELKVEMDADEEFKDYFSETWPKALGKLKEICEK